MIIAVLLFIVSVAVGVYQGRVETNLFTRIATGLALLTLSNSIACWPYFGADPSSWLRTYVTGLLQTGLASLAFHVVPFFLAWHVSKRMWSG